MTNSQIPTIAKETNKVLAKNIEAKVDLLFPNFRTDRKITKMN